MKNKKGFTLIEAVICLGLVSVISAAFLYVTLGAVSAQRAGSDYEQQSTRLISALEMGELSSDMQQTPAGRIELNLGNGYTVTLGHYRLSVQGEEQGIAYYRYDA